MSKRKKDLNVLMLFLRVAEQDRDAALADAEALRIELAETRTLLCAARSAGREQEREIAGLVKALAEKSDMEEHARHYDESRAWRINLTTIRDPEGVARAISDAMRAGLGGNR